MKNILVEINCKTCLFHTHLKSDTMILPELEPELKQKLMQEAFFNFTCPCCGKPIQFIHPFLYHDKYHKFMIFMNTEHKQINELQLRYPSTAICYVHKPSEIKERILIMEDGYDDEVVMVIKQRVLKKYPRIEHMFYRDSEHETLWFDVIRTNKEHDIIGIETTIYQSLKQKKESAMHE